MSLPQSLASLYRNGRIESQHFGSIAVVDAKGRLVAHAGDPYQNIYLRSCAKPFQASVVVSSGAKDRFGLTDQEVAVIAASHSGEPIHTEAVKSILTKIGLSENALLCGPKSAALESPLFHNCSGKHAGMLAVAVDMGWSTGDYLDPSHPVQKAIREALADASGVPESRLEMAVDGCSAPTFYMPLVGLARAFARLSSPSNHVPAVQPSFPTTGSLVGAGRTWSRSDAFAAVAKAMMENPKMVAGTKRLDTEVMIALPGRIVSKGGAEGVQGAVIDGLGIAIKIAEGNGRRTAGPVLLEVLRQMDLVNDEDLKVLAPFRTVPEINARGTHVGELRPEFRLERTPL